MKKHELLKYAYDNYPKGTIARFGGKLPDHVSTGKFVITDLNNNGNIQVMSENGVECFFADNEWAEIVSDKKPLLVSEDGVELFEGDSYYRAEFYHSKWVLSEYTKDCIIEGLELNHAVIHSPTDAKAFSAKQAALEWIEAQKPKEIEVILYDYSTVRCFVTKDMVRFGKNNVPYGITNLNPSDIKAINKAMEEIQNA